MISDARRFSVSVNTERSLGPDLTCRACYLFDSALVHMIGLDNGRHINKMLESGNIMNYTHCNLAVRGVGRGSHRHTAALVSGVHCGRKDKLLI